MWEDLFKVLFLGNRMNGGTIKWNKKYGQGNTLRGRKTNDDFIEQNLEFEKPLGDPS